jgi:hypothetical protein
MSEQFKEWIQETPLYQAMVNVGYFPVWGNEGSKWRIVYWSIPYAPLPLRIRQLNERSSNPRVIQEPYENCDLHQALINVGYEIRRKTYCINGKDTDKVVDYYAPAIDYTTYKSESHSATLWRLQELDRRLGTDFYGDYKRDCRGFSTGL